MDSKKTKIIDTSSLQIKGHLISWADVRIQISNVSAVTTMDAPIKSFPWMFLLLFFFGIYLKSEAYYSDFLETFSVLLIIVSIGRVAIWCWEFWIAISSKYLMIEVNSGNTFALKFRNEEFLKEVMEVFSNIFIDDGEQYKNLQTTINIERGNIETVVVENPKFSNGSNMIENYYDNK